MDKRIETVRLSGVVLMSLAATVFVYYYSQYLSIRMDVVYHATSLTPACHFLTDYGWAGLVLPVVASILGVVTISTQRRFLHEVVLVVTLLLAVIWALFTVVAWQITQIPVFTHMEWHY